MIDSFKFKLNYDAIDEKAICFPQEIYIFVYEGSKARIRQMYDGIPTDSWYSNYQDAMEILEEWTDNNTYLLYCPEDN